VHKRRTCPAARYTKQKSKKLHVNIFCWHLSLTEVRAGSGQVGRIEAEEPIQPASSTQERVKTKI
jgi:hypothetical protein